VQKAAGAANTAPAIQPQPQVAVMAPASAAPVLQEARTVASSSAGAMLGAVPTTPVVSSVPSAATVTQQQLGTAPAPPLQVLATSPVAVPGVSMSLQPPTFPNLPGAPLASGSHAVTSVPVAVTPTGTQGPPLAPLIATPAPTQTQGTAQSPAPGTPMAGSEAGTGVVNRQGAPTSPGSPGAGSSSPDASLPPLDVSKGWPKGVPHGEPQILPGEPF
jgi:hypothetical protein